MIDEPVIDQATNRKFYLVFPDSIGEDLTFVLNIHGGGSFGAWQRLYFPAQDYVDKYRLAIATPTAATAEPMRRWVAEADDEHLQNVVEIVFQKFGPRIRSFWLVGHSQGGMTSRRLLSTDYFASRVDGFLSLSGGRLGGRAEVVENFGPPRRSDEQRLFGDARARRAAFAAVPDPDTDLSFIFATGEYEIKSLPETSALAEKLGAGARRRIEDVVDVEPGQVYDKRREGRSSQSWGLLPRPGTAEVFIYPGAKEGRVIADIVRRDKGHTEGLEPKITEEIVKLMVGAPGGKARALLKTV